MPDHRRILMVSSTVARGGCERQILGTAAGLIERGFQVALLAFVRPPSGESLEAEFQKSCIPLYFSDEFRLRLDGEALNELAFSLPHDMFNFAASVQSAILEYRPHVVHAWSDYAAVVAGQVAAALNVPRIVLGQRNVPPLEHQRERSRIFWEGYRALAANPRVVLTNNSARNATGYEAWLKLPKGAVAVVPNALWPKTLRMPSRAEIEKNRLNYGLPPDVKIVGSLMRFVEEKDPDLWLDTAKEVARTRDDVRFILAGYGVLRDRIAAKIVDLGLLPRVTLLDTITDLAPFYGFLDVFLMTSRFEGIPNVLIEAQATGCPIAATEVGGISEAAVEGLTAQIVRKRSASELAGAILQILEDHDWSSRARAAGPRVVQERFSHERVIAQTVDLYYPRRSLIGKLLMQAKERWFRSAAHAKSRALID